MENKIIANDKIMDAKTFVTLADGYMKQKLYEHDLYESITKVSNKHHVDTDFLGLPLETELLGDAVLEAIHQFDEDEDFEYFFYECDGDFEYFNSAITWTAKNGVTYSPDVHSLEQLYYYILSGKTSDPSENREFVKVVEK